MQLFCNPVITSFAARNRSLRWSAVACSASLVFGFCPPLNAAPPGGAADKHYDIVVYGGTAGGAVAAVQAARMGKTVALIASGTHVGGLTSGGLGATDIGNKGAIGGISREFYQRLGKYYGDASAWKQQSRDAFLRGRQGAEEEMWTFEPRVAELVLRQMLAEAKVAVIVRERLDLQGGVELRGRRIVSIVLESGDRFHAKMFIDASYEGDLMAKAGVAFHVGREANAAYKETLNGVQLGAKTHQFLLPVDPFRIPGQPASGLLPGIHDGGPGEQGTGDSRVQAYNFRMCMTDAPENRLPFPKPAGYDPLRYELLARYIRAGAWDVPGHNTPLPNRKTDTNNNGGFSTDNIGMNYDYPEGDYALREKIFNEHVTYQQGLMWFLSHDERVPEKLQREINRWGLAADEFVETAGWPHQLYVREARRMISDYVMTQHDCQGRVKAADSVGLAAYGMDSHNVQRYVSEGLARNEGDVQVHGFSPYPVAYRSIVPREKECENLLIPVCLAATHIAYGSIRMEPVFMVLGQSAATAAALAIDADTPVQRVDIGRLQARLNADKQILTWTASPAKSATGLDPAKLPGLVLDDNAAVLTGSWVSSSATPGFVGGGYLHDGNADQGQKQATFAIKVKKAGRYELRLAYTPHENRTTKAEVTVSSAEGKKTLTVNQRLAPAKENSGFVSLGKFRFAQDALGSVTISNRDSDGYVIVDAVQLLGDAE